MKDGSGVICRALDILGDLLKEEIHDRKTIAKRYDVGLAAADRYIRALQRVPGVVLGKRGRCPTIRFSFGEAVPTPSHPTAVAACWASGLADVFKDSSYARGIRDALAYVTGHARRSGEFKELDRKFLFVARGGESALAQSQGNLDDLVQAVLRSYFADIEYCHFNGKREAVRVRPISLAIYDHQIYLIALRPDNTRDAFRLSRIHKVDVTADKFPYPQRAVYDPRQMFRDAFGIFIRDEKPPVRVRIRLEPRWQYHCQSHTWHESQRIDEVPGGIVVTLTVRPCWELKAWILGFGPDAVVLEPADLAAEMRGLVAKMSDRYGVTPHRKRKPKSEDSVKGKAADLRRK